MNWFSEQVSAVATLFFPSTTTQDHALMIAREFRDSVSEVTPDGNEFTGMWQAHIAPDGAATIVTLGHSRNPKSVLEELARQTALENGVTLENFTYEIDGVVRA